MGEVPTRKDVAIGSTSARPWCGRNEELDRLVALVEDARHGTGSWLRVVGAAGSGKTALAQRFAQLCADRSVRCHLGLTSPVAGVARTGVVVDTAMVGAEPTLGVRRWRDLAEFADLLDRGSEDATTVVVLDDLHELDERAATTLWELGRRWAYRPIVLVGLGRPRPWPAVAERAWSGGPVADAEPLQLGPLGDADVEALVRAITGAAPSPAVAKLLAGAGGNPFLVTTIAEAAASGELGGPGWAPSPDGAESDDDGGELPVASARVIAHRMVDRGPGQLGLARRLAVLDRPAAVSELARILDVSVRQAVATLEEMTGAGLLVDGPDGVTFAQEVVARALRIDVGPSVRTALHREVGAALADTGAPVAEVSRHLAAGAAHGDRNAVEWLLRSVDTRVDDGAGDRLSGAVATLRRARRLASGTPMQDEVEARLAQHLGAIGRFDEATEIASDGLRRASSPLVRATFLEALSDVALARGQNHRAMVLLEQTYAIDGIDRVRRARLLARLAVAEVWAFQLDEARRNGEQAVAEGSALGLTDVAAIGWSVCARLASLRGEFDIAVEHAKRAVTMSDLAGDGALHTFHHHMAGLVFANADRFDEAAAMYREGATSAARRGDGPGEIRCLSALTVLDYQRGDWDDAIRHGRRVMSLSRSLGASLAANLASGLLGLIALHRGDRRAADRRLLAGLAERDDPEANPAGHLAVAELALRLTTLHDDGVGETVDQVLDLLDEHLANAPIVLVFLGLDLVAAAIRLGRVERARAVTAALADVAERAGTPTSTGLAKVCGGLVADDATLALAGVEELRGSPHVIVRARALAETALLALRVGAPGGAELVEDAATAFSALRAVSDLEALRTAAAVAGVGLDEREVTSRAEDHWERLTPAEREVLALLAEGLSNSAIAGRLFVSRRTVETHVSRIYAKSGIGNRVVLAQEANRRRERSGR